MPNPKKKPAPKPLKGRYFSQAISEELAKSNHKKLHQLARVLVSKAAKGDTASLKEVADRVEGKAVQSVDVGGDFVIQVNR
jgi:hypothetical protein